MSKVVVFTNLTLDGVMQAPGRPDEDRRGGFEHGGWATPYAAMAEARESTATTSALLLGRRTYEDFYAVWPNRTDNPYTEVLNDAGGAALVEQLHASQGRRRGGCGQAKGGAGQGSRDHGQRRTGPVADAGQPHRRVRAPHPPAGAGIGTPSLPRRQCLCHSPACRGQDDEHRRRDRDLRSHALSVNPHILRAESVELSWSQTLQD